MIPETAIQEVREKADIVAVIGEHVRLSKSGASHKGLCPFHDEKTPSFYVHGSRGFYHCFGCGASGDAIKFIQEVDGLSFPEAVRNLAARAGIHIEETDAGDVEERREKKRLADRLVEINGLAAGFYLAQLETEAGAQARDVIANREVTAETAEKFRLGYAPARWDGLCEYLSRHDIDLEQAALAGLVVPRRSGRGYYDRFRHRLMFPIADRSGRIVAFSGRALPPPPGTPEPDEKPAKYINSPESPVYTKGEVLFGMHEGRVQLRKRAVAILCEGNFDLVALHQAGFENAVAPMGTALTPEQARLLRRFVERVVLLFDGDKAGAKAAAKAHPVLAEASLAAKVVELPEGDDPDTFLRRAGADALRERIELAPGVIDWMIDAAVQRAGVDVQAKAEEVEALGPALAVLGSAVEKEIYVQKIVQKFNLTDATAVKRQLRQGTRVARAPREDGPKTPDKPRKMPFRAPETERSVVQACLDAPALLTTPEVAQIAALLTNDQLRAILQTASGMVEHSGALLGGELINRFAGQPAEAWLKQCLAISRFTEALAEEHIRASTQVLAIDALKREAEQLKPRIDAARKAGQQDHANELSRALLALRREASRLERGSDQR